MTDDKKTKESIEEKKQRAKEFSEEMESKLRKAERHNWMKKDLDYISK